MPQSKHHFRLKGKTAEKFVEDLAQKSFLLDWCFPNPILPNGKELCDLFVVFDRTAIIWQIKDLKLGSNGRYRESETDKNLRQLSGARRQLFDLKTSIELKNARRTIEAFDPASISEVFLISVLLGEGEDFFTFVEESKDYCIHIFTRKSVEILLTELDTIADFTDYLRAKEAFVEDKPSLVIEEGEEELLAAYLLNGRSFGAMDKAPLLLIEEGAWSAFRNSARYQSRKKEDETSYSWDAMIDRAHEGSEKYETMARELARPNRFQRRVLAKIFFDAHLAAHRDRVHDHYRTMLSLENTTYCFVFCDKKIDRKFRQKILEKTCSVAPGRFPQNHKVVGIATENRFQQTCSYDFCLVHVGPLTSNDQEAIKRRQKQLGMWQNPSVREGQEKEYPD